MNVEFSKRAVADLRKISAYSKRRFGELVATALESRIREIVGHLRDAPNSAPEVEQRPGVHVIPLIRYPYRIFYRIAGGTVRILHIRHTSRRTWRGE